MALFSKDISSGAESGQGTATQVPDDTGQDVAGDSPGDVGQDAPGGPVEAPGTIAQAPGEVDTVAPIAEPPPIEAGPRKRGRPSKAEMAARLNGVTPAPPKPAPIPTPQIVAQKIVDYETLGQTAANLWFNVGHLALGDDWIPAQNEVMPVKNAFRDYFKTTNITEIPPAWNLALVLGGYTLARLQKPTVKSRFNLALAWVKTKFRRGE